MNACKLTSPAFAVTAAVLGGLALAITTCQGGSSREVLPDPVDVRPSGDGLQERGATRPLEETIEESLHGRRLRPDPSINLTSSPLRRLQAFATSTPHSMVLLSTTSLVFFRRRR